MIYCFRRSQVRCSVIFLVQHEIVSKSDMVVNIAYFRMKPCSVFDLWQNQQKLLPMCCDNRFFSYTSIMTSRMRVMTNAGTYG